MLLKYAERVHGARLSGVERPWLPWEHCELFCEELCGRETERREGERSRRREASSGRRSRVKDRGRIERRREKMGETGSDRLCLKALVGLPSCTSLRSCAVN